MALDPAALHLRFRDDAAAEPPAPPDVAAFLRSGAVAEGPDLEDELGVLPGTGPADPEAPLVVFFQHPDFEIPAPGYDHSLPDLACWSVRATTFGWVASVPTRSTTSSPALASLASTRGQGPRHASQVLAGCLALALPTHASAQAPATPPPVQTPAAAPAKSPRSPGPKSGSKSAKKPESGPAREPTKPESSPADEALPASPPTIEPTPAPEPVPTTPPATPPEVTPTTPPKDAAPGILTPDAVSDAAWEGVDGFDVIVRLKGGRLLRGRVGAIQAETFTLINGSDGQILVIPKSGVSSLRAYVPPPVPTKTGTGLLVGGGILTALGGPVFITGVTFLALCPSCTYLHLPMLIVGGAALGGGIPMIARGVKQRAAFQKALQEQRLTPMVTRTPFGGWSGGLQLRF